MHDVEFPIEEHEEWDVEAFPYGYTLILNPPSYKFIFSSSAIAQLTDGLLDDVGLDRYLDCVEFTTDLQITHWKRDDRDEHARFILRSINEEIDEFFEQVRTRILARVRWGEG